MHPDAIRRVAADMDCHQQRCKACGQPDKFDFNVEDEVWRRVVPSHLQNRVVCLACFDDFARSKGVKYSHALRALYFAGKRASFCFKVEARAD